MRDITLNLFVKHNYRIYHSTYSTTIIISDIQQIVAYYIVQYIYIYVIIYNYNIPIHYMYIYIYIFMI